jgi:hypothetical protein
MFVCFGGVAMICFMTIEKRSVYFAASEYFEILSPGYESRKEARQAESGDVGAGIDLLVESGIASMSLQQCNDELGAAGHYSCHTCVHEARAAIVALRCEISWLVVRAADVANARQQARIAAQGSRYTEQELFQHWCDECDSVGDWIDPELVFHVLLS